MKKVLYAVLIVVVLLANGLYADAPPQYPDWEWNGNQWVYTGDDLDPPPPPILPDID